MRWHVVADNMLAPREKKVWTLSKSPTECGWETDNGFSGYGLSYADAKFLADAANEKLASEELKRHS